MDKKTEKTLLNSDLLNDTESIYFQIDRFTFVKFPAEETGDFLTFFSKCYKAIKDQGVEHRALFIPFNIYNNIVCLINDDPLFELTDTIESVFEKVGIIEKNIVVYVPDALKDMVRL